MVKKKKFGISKSLTDSLSKTVQIADQNAGTLRYEIVPIDSIDLDPDNPRELSINKKDIVQGISQDDANYSTKQKELQELESLSHSIKTKGVLNPIWIHKEGINYKLIMGERRLLASLLSKKHDIPAKVLDRKPVTSELRLLQWIENLERSDLSLWEKISNLKMLLNAKVAENPATVINATYIKNILGCSLPHAMNYHAVIHAGDQVMAAIKNGKINNLEKAALVANAKDNELFNIMYEKCLSGASLRDMQQCMRLFKQGKANHPIDNVSTQLKPKDSKISLGHCKSNKTIETIVAQLSKSAQFKSYLTGFEGIDWDSETAASSAFRKFIKKLEKSI